MKYGGGEGGGCQVERECLVRDAPGSIREKRGWVYGLEKFSAWYLAQL